MIGLAKKKNKQVSATKEHQQKKRAKEELWMLRLKFSIIYILLWIVSMAWVTNNLPDPASAAKFYEESKAHWFMNSGIAIMFIVIQYHLGKENDESEDAESVSES